MPRTNQFRRQFAGRAGTRRQTEWGISMTTAAPVTIPANSAVMIANTAGGLTVPITIVRTRGFLSVFSDQAAATETQIGAFGMGIVSAQARAAGVASVPDPAGNATWDGWFVHEFFGQRLQFNSGVGLEPAYAQRYEIDSKAMRKIDASSEDIVFVVANLSATQGLAVLFGARFLLKNV